MLELVRPFRSGVRPVFDFGQMDTSANLRRVAALMRRSAPPGHLWSVARQTETLGEKPASSLQAALVERMSDANRNIPFTGNAHRGKPVGGREHIFDGDDFVTVAVNEEDMRACCRLPGRDGLVEMFRADENAGKPDDRGRRLRSPQTDMERHFGTLAEADDSQAGFVETIGLQSLAEEFVEDRARLRDAAPTLHRIARRKWKPLSGNWRIGTGIGRIRSNERDGRQQRLPLPA